jgi:mannose-6-phosphate isomerase-like protein (cupin superfamily)
MPSHLEHDLEHLAERPADSELYAGLVGHGAAVLPVLPQFLSRDLPIAVLERYEELYKDLLRPLLTSRLSLPQAWELARVQLEIGLLLKYKSYAVKASSPLGYSLFLQEPGQGFSFQRHITHKTEVFHILDPQENGYIFLCSYEQWNEVYEPHRFSAWLQGADDPGYERFRHPARAGDVYVLDQLGVVHTVVGCILEEFATISTDMVERLHDQNIGRTTPSHFERSWVYEQLPGIRAPESSTLVEGEAANPRRTALPATTIPGGRRTLLLDGFLRAVQIEIDPGATSSVVRDEHHAMSLYVRSGRGQILLGAADELARNTPPALPIGATNLLTVPQDIPFQVVSEGKEPLVLVEHAIDPAVALFSGA